MFWALEKRLTETVLLRTHNTCIRQHRDIVIEPNIRFRRSKTSHRDCSFEYPKHIYQTRSFSVGMAKTYGFVLGTF